MVDGPKSFADLLRKRDAIQEALTAVCSPVLTLSAEYCGRTQALLREVYTDEEFASVIVAVEMPPEPHRGLYHTKQVFVRLPMAALDNAQALTLEDVVSCLFEDVEGSHL